MPPEPPERPPAPPHPLVAAVEMGYGHLRAAHALATELGVAPARVDLPPFARPGERRLWDFSRSLYEGLSRASQRRLLEPLLRPVLELVTAIEPFEAGRDQSEATWVVRRLEAMVARGTGRALAEHLRTTGSPLVATYFLPALAADFAARQGELASDALAGAEPPLFCLVTDADLARAWVSADPAPSRIRYCAASPRAADRLRAYGVAPARIETTGFPLPGELLGGPDFGVLRIRLAARIARLDRRGRFLASHGERIAPALGELPRPSTEPPLLAYAVGGAGAQTALARRLLRGLAPLLARGELRLALVAGVRREVAERFRDWIEAVGPPAGSVEVLHAPSLPDYFPAFNRLMARTDVLWTKPSELTFFAGLGLPLLLAPSVGTHERYNRRWAAEAGAALAPGRPEEAAAWLPRLLDDGRLAAAAWAGFEQLPSGGLYRIVRAVREAA